VSEKDVCEHGKCRQVPLDSPFVIPPVLSEIEGRNEESIVRLGGIAPEFTKLNWSLISAWILRKLRITEEEDPSLLLLPGIVEGFQDDRDPVWSFKMKIC